ncbi:MAG: LysR family transcriptional regulator [Bacteroidales bacterium]|nr:LysR family transcriptional regulator [Bacteroidales bacterium]
MNFLTMEYFLAVAQEKNFTRAAARLNITQQTLSAHIGALEKELGCRLFDRTKPLRLTYAGETLLRYAGEITLLNHSLQKEFADLRAQSRGRLRLGLAHTRGRVLLPDILEAYHRQYPGVEVEIREGQNRQLPQRLKKGELDLIIAIPRTEEPEIVWEDFYWEKILLMGSRNLLRRVLGKEAEEIQKELDQRGDLSPLKNCPFLLGAAGDINADVGRALLRQSGVIPLVSARSENMETLLELCLREIGLCFCPDTLARRVLTPEQRREVFGFSLGDQARYLLRFGTLKQRYQPREIQDFIALCREIRPLG